MKQYTRFQTPLWEIILVGNADGLTNVHMVTGQGKREFIVEDNWVRNDEMFAVSRDQLNEYFTGTRTQFDIPLNPEGTKYQKRVWQALSEIPYGTLRTYKEVAQAIGNEKASRAVGMANSKNPLPIIVPCHRVIGSSGKLTGFAHGLEAKQQLIEFEKSTRQTKENVHAGSHI